MMMEMITPMIIIRENMVPMVSETSFSFFAPKYWPTSTVPPTVRPATMLMTRLVICAPLVTPESTSVGQKLPTISISATE